MKIVRYAVSDEQSNRTLAKPSLLDQLQVETRPAPYKLNTCAGPKWCIGRRVERLVIESHDGRLQYNLPEVVECDSNPGKRLEREKEQRSTLIYLEYPIRFRL